MITEIKMEGVATYKAPTSLKTDKKVNLIYGLNGTGKSTLSRFLQSPNDAKYSRCSVAPPTSATVLVYNQNFIRDNFFVADKLRGIFSLSKENKTAERKVLDAEEELIRLEGILAGINTRQIEATQDFVKHKQTAVDNIWAIKTVYSGGDRVLEYCLEGLKGQKEKLFEHLLSLEKPEKEPSKTEVELKREVASIIGEDAQTVSVLSPLAFTKHDIEAETIFAQPIVGNKDAVVANLIEQLGNSDWVREGLSYVPELVDGVSACPFCQQPITDALVKQVTSYFDNSFRESTAKINGLEKEYAHAIQELCDLGSFLGHPLAGEHKHKLQNSYEALTNKLNLNHTRILQKQNNPKTIVTLFDTKKEIALFNEVVSEINTIITKHNLKIENKADSLAGLKKDFWELMRWKYDQTVARYKEDSASYKKKCGDLLEETESISKTIENQKNAITDARKATINIDEAIENINASLLDLAIEDFVIKKHSNNLYRIVRPGGSEDAFQTLSEGERMIISFLYFCELCKGRLTPQDTNPNRVVVIDDPISSLSHIYIFNVGRLIKNLFFNSDKFEQIFVLTHSLYFFYELTETRSDRRAVSQNLFRIIKNANGSTILPMSYNEIQNDYQAYWQIVKDPDQPPALIANCMRNIVEYFFGFVKKKDLNNVFQQPALSGAKHQAFCRYINRESHSDGQNLFDLKEFDYEVFRDGLRAIFQKSGFGEHYEQMMKP